MMLIKQMSCLKVGVSWVTLWLLMSGLSLGFAQDTDLVRTVYVAWSPDGQYLATAADGQVRIIDVATQQVVNNFIGEQRPSTAPIWSPDGQRLGFSTGQAFEIWFSPTDIPVLEGSYPGPSGSSASSWRPDGRIIALSIGEYVEFWDAMTHTSIKHYHSSETGPLWTLDWTHDSADILIGGRAVRIIDYDTETSNNVFYLSSYLDSYGSRVNPVARSAVWSPSQQQIAIGSPDAVRVLDLGDYAGQSQVLLEPYWPSHTFFSGHRGQVYSVDWHPSGRYVASGGADGTIRIWDVETGQQINIIEFPDNVMVRSVAWSPDGTQLACGSPTGGPEVVIVPSSDLLPLTADAGPDQTFTADPSGFATVTLDGSASFGPDGEIVSYVWTLDDVEIATGAVAEVQLGAGVHAITLTVTDDDGMSASDTVTITVVAASTPTLTLTTTPTDTPTATLTSTPAP